MSKITRKLSKLLLLLFIQLLTAGLIISCGDDDITEPDDSEKYVTNTIVLRDWQYLDGKILDLGRLGGDIIDFDTLAGDEITDIKVFKRYYTTLPDTFVIEAFMYVDPDDTTFAPNETEFCFVEEVEHYDYCVDADDFWIMFDVPNAGTYNSELGVWMVVERGDGAIDTIGNISEEPYHLKLIKGRYPYPDDITFDYVWRNVYSLGLNEWDIDLDRLDAKIYQGLANTENSEDNPDHNEEGVPFITLLELDKYDNNGNPIPDGEVDKYTSIILPEQAILIFPDREPFDSPALDERVPEIYEYRWGLQQMQEASTYYLKITQTRLIADQSLIGDINLNGVYYEIADLELFRSYFMNGLGVFTVDEAMQMEATDIFSDGKTLTVSDFVYLVRIITGDFLPIPDPIPETQLNMVCNNSQISIDQEVGAIYMEFVGNPDCSLANGATDMEMSAFYDGAKKRVLIYSYDTDLTASGTILDCNACPTTVDAADYDGLPYRIQIQ